MRTAIHSNVFLLTLVLLAPVAASGQRRQQPGPTEAQIAVDLKIGAAPYQISGAGTCTHAPQAAIYNVRSQLRTVQHSGEGRSVQLTVWDPLDGSEDMFSLSTNVGTASRDVSTVRGGPVTGSGKVTFEPAGNGGTFRIAAKAPDGTSISGTIKCDAFTPHVAEGG